MKKYQQLLAGFAVVFFSCACFSVEIEMIPPTLSAAQKIPFAKERADLIADKKTTNAKLARYNRQCGNPKPYQANKCNIDRQNMLKTVDTLNNRITDFNKRLADAEKGVSVTKNK